MFGSYSKGIVIDEVIRNIVKNCLNYFYKNTKLIFFMIWHFSKISYYYFLFLFLSLHTKHTLTLRLLCSPRWKGMHNSITVFFSLIWCASSTVNRLHYRIPLSLLFVRIFSLVQRVKSSGRRERMHIDADFALQPNPSDSEEAA